jgi:DNA-directed RNA polymerase specialized sigma24 family protein
LPTFDEFFRAEYGEVVWTVMLAGASVAEAQDAVSNAMIEAFLSWPLLEKPAAWVRAVAVQDYSENARRSRPVIRPSDKTRVSVGGGPADEDALMRSALVKLSPAQRTVTALDVAGYEVARIAQMLGKPAKSVRSTLTHASNRLRRELES